MELNEWHTLQDDKTLVFERGGCVFIFNFHATKSFSDYKIGVGVSGTYAIALDSDRPEFGGHSLVSPEGRYTTFNEGFNGRPHHLCVYIPSRVALVLNKVD